MSEKIKITLPDQTVIEADRGSTVESVVASIGPGLLKAAVAARLDSDLVDLSCKIDGDTTLQVLTNKDPDSLEILRHTVSHVMAQAVKRLYPAVKLAIGPAIDDGFYYDFDLDDPLSDKDLEKIEGEMRKIEGEDLEVSRVEIVRHKALEKVNGLGETYKTELIGDREGESFSFYAQGEFIDLCRGPHMARTGKLGAFKLLKVAGAYWRGDSNRKMLQRIYGTAFFGKKELKQHLALLDEAKKRDHRKLGKELDLFSFHPDAPASPFFHPKGAKVYNLLIDHVRSLYEQYGFDEVITPQIMGVDLWHRSGHYENYQENMFFTSIDNRDFAVKPMNCPGHVLIYKTGVRSYRDLPLRYADFGRLHRYELSGVTAGLTRVRTFAQDDAHIFCTPEQIEAEIRSQIKMFLDTYSRFGFEGSKIYLSTRPEKSIGSDEIWEISEGALKTVLVESGNEFMIDPGAGVFYGPKIDFKVQDAMKREWQLGTIQLDFSMPERFDLEYITAEGDRPRPVMIHRAMLGSIERFLGVLIEHCGGAFPLWLAPLQFRAINVTDRQRDYCEKIVAALRGMGLRGDADLRNEKIGFKIRQATLEKIPFMLIIGDLEFEKETVSVRDRTEGDCGAMALNDFAAMLHERIKERS